MPSASKRDAAGKELRRSENGSLLEKVRARKLKMMQHTEHRRPSPPVDVSNPTPTRRNKMDTADLHELVGDLSTNIDDLEAALSTLTQKPLATTSSKLPLLDKAKLHVLATYALESILFNSLRLSGTDAKSHAVFAELNRVKEYFGKIKTAEGAGAKPTTRVDKDAAGRFIKAGLAGNDRYDKERQERSARERAGAKRKLEDIATGTHTRFDGAAKRIRTADEQNAALAKSSTRDGTDEEVEGGVALSGSGAEEKKSKRKKKPTDPERKEKRARRQRAKEEKLSSHETSEAMEARQDGDGGGQPTGKSSKAPKSSKEALDSLLDGASPQSAKKGKKKKKGKEQALEDARAEETK